MKLDKPRQCYNSYMIRALNLIVLCVKDPQASADFYKLLGFQVLSQNERLAEIRLGDMKFDLISTAAAADNGPEFEKEATSEPKGAGLYLNIETSAIDTFYQTICNLGLEPSSKPRNWPWKHREFVLRDPDGYKLVFFEKLSKKR